MTLDLTEQQRMVRDLVREFVERRLKPVAAEIDRSGRFPTDIVRELGRLGIMGSFLPERYGGAGLDYVSYAIAVEELAVGCAATAVVCSAHSSLACWPVLSAGSEALRQRYLPRMARGEWVGCFALSEPGAGSDAGAQKTTARRDGSVYVINGSKNFITNGPAAQVAIVFASTAPELGNRGISAFVVETGWPGFEVVRIEEKMGIHGAQSAQLAFTDLRVPLENRLGAENDGFRLALRTLDGGRIGIAAQAVGIARAALEDSLAYVKMRRAFGGRVADFQGVQWMLADMATEVDAARLLVQRASFLKDRGLPYSREAATAKLFASEAAMRIAVKAVQLHGGYGYTREFNVERYFRDAKITEIYEGTSEIQRLVIATSLLRHGV